MLGLQFRKRETFSLVKMNVDFDVDVLIHVDYVGTTNKNGHPNSKTGGLAISPASDRDGGIESERRDGQVIVKKLTAS